MILFPCPCGRELRLADDLLGKRIRCPECGDTLLVEQAIPQRKPHQKRRKSRRSTSDEPALRPRKKKKSRPQRENSQPEYFDDYSQSPLPAARRKPSKKRASKQRKPFPRAIVIVSTVVVMIVAVGILAVAVLKNVADRIQDQRLGSSRIEIVSRPNVGVDGLGFECEKIQVGEYNVIIPAGLRPHTMELNERSWSREYVGGLNEIVLATQKNQTSAESKLLLENAADVARLAIAEMGGRYLAMQTESKDSPAWLMAFWQKTDSRGSFVIDLYLLRETSSLHVIYDVTAVPESPSYQRLLDCARCTVSENF